MDYTGLNCRWGSSLLGPVPELRLADIVVHPAEALDCTLVHPTSCNITVAPPFKDSVRLKAIDELGIAPAVDESNEVNHLERKLSRLL